MDTGVIIALISLAGTLITATVSLINSSRIKKLDSNVTAYHGQVDGMKTELVEAVKGRGEAEGNLTGRTQQTEENKIK